MGDNCFNVDELIKDLKRIAFQYFSRTISANDLAEIMKGEKSPEDLVEVLKAEIEKETQTKIKVAFFGQPGAGKSSLMNKLAGKKLADAGIQPGVKITKHIWGENDSIEFTDLPGFDGIPDEHKKEEYWSSYDCDQFDLFICCFESKFNQADADFFKRVIDKGKRYIFVRTKSDAIYDEEKSVSELKGEIIKEQVQKVFGESINVVFTSTRTNEGLSELQDEIIELLDRTQKDKWFRNAKSFSKRFLEEKKYACKNIVFQKAFISAANGAVPVPLLSAPIDLMLFINLLSEIKSCYGLTNSRLKQLEQNKNMNQGIALLCQKVLSYVGEKGAILLLQRFAGQEFLKQISKVIPIVLGAATGFALTYVSGMQFLNDCHEIAEAILEEEFGIHGD